MGRRAGRRPAPQGRRRWARGGAPQDGLEAGGKCAAAALVLVVVRASRLHGVGRGISGGCCVSLKLKSILICAIVQYGNDSRRRAGRGASDHRTGGRGEVVPAPSDGAGTGARHAWSSWSAWRRSATRSSCWCAAAACRSARARRCGFRCVATRAPLRLLKGPWRARPGWRVRAPPRAAAADEPRRCRRRIGCERDSATARGRSPGAPAGRSGRQPERRQDHGLQPPDRPERARRQLRRRDRRAPPRYAAPGGRRRSCVSSSCSTCPAATLSARARRRSRSRSTRFSASAATSARRWPWWWSTRGS